MELVHELQTEIERIPAVDVHSRVKMRQSGASDLADVVLTPDVRGELLAAGVAKEMFEIEGTKKRLQEIAPAFASIANTTTCWCLARIFEDLYELAPAHECTTEAALAQVEPLAGDEGWYASVLDKANVFKCLVGCDWRSPLPQASDRFSPILRVDSLINEAHMSRTLDALGEVTGQSVYEVADLKKAVIALFRKAKESGAVAASASFEPQVDFDPGDRDSADRILSLILLGQKTNREDRKAIRSYVMDLVLQNCAEHDMPMQLVLGTKYSKPLEAAIAAMEPTMLSMYADLFARHSGATFDILAAHEGLCHEFAIVSRSTPNVYLSGYWRHLAFPTHIRKIIRERIEMLPMTHCCGLVSAASCIEWVYARTTLLRRELSIVLAALVREECLSEGAAIEIARHYLQDNPRRIYSL